MGRNSSLLQAVRQPLVKIARIVLRKELAGRQYTPFADDICLVAYPKSGNTWLRFLVGNLLHPENPVTFANIESIAPSIYHNPDHILRRIPRPRVLKSHEAFFSRHGKVVYI
ncbi:MAG: sulfotransferase domain-containing protein, partial [Terriglobia bacterium]